jgi:hypothetical protein
VSDIYSTAAANAQHRFKKSIALIRLLRTGASHAIFSTASTQRRQFQRELGLVLGACFAESRFQIRDKAPR